MSRSLLAHVVARFAPRQWENIATESLLYLLSRPGAAEAMRHVVSPAGLDLPGGLHWRTQAAAATDDSIPDLVADDDQGRHVLIVEAKFWAGLTRNQPVGYLARQQQQFGNDRPDSLLVFVAPARRVELLAAELAARLTGGRVVDQQGVPVVDGIEGRLAVVSWGAVLNVLQAALSTDQDALADLDQLRGLCDRADSEAVLPLAADEVGSSVGRRAWEFADLVDRATDRLIAEGVVDTKGLRATGAKGWYGRYIRTQDGNVFRFSVSAYHWGHLHPTPWWLRFYSPSTEVEASLRRLLGTDIAHLHRSGAGHLYAGLTVPLSLEGDRLIGRLVEQVRAVCEALPARAVQDSPPEESGENGAPDT